ncbi:MAG: acyl-CoA thioesterase [Ilumatobacteraceae bacterium]
MTAKDDYPQDAPAIRTLAMPADCNSAGDIFGGWLMAQMDLAAANVSVQRARGRSATVAVDGFTFHHPVKVGDEVSVFARIIREGRSSMHIAIETWRRERFSGFCQKVSQATFVCVALDEAGRPRELPAFP